MNIFKKKTRNKKRVSSSDLKLFYDNELGMEVDKDSFVTGNCETLYIIEFGNDYPPRFHNLTYDYTLNDIRKMYPKALVIEVIFEMALEGYIFTYNNYGDNKWRLTGITRGYA